MGPARPRPLSKAGPPHDGRGPRAAPAGRRARHRGVVGTWSLTGWARRNPTRWERIRWTPAGAPQVNARARGRRCGARPARARLRAGWRQGKKKQNGRTRRVGSRRRFRGLRGGGGEGRARGGRGSARHPSEAWGGPIRQRARRGRAPVAAGEVPPPPRPLNSRSGARESRHSFLAARSEQFFFARARNCQRFGCCCVVGGGGRVEEAWEGGGGGSLRPERARRTGRAQGRGRR